MKRKIFNVAMTVFLFLGLLMISPTTVVAASSEANFLAFTLDGQSGDTIISPPKPRDWLTISMNGGVSWNHFGPPAEPFANNWDAVFQEGSGSTTYENNVIGTLSDYLGGARVICQSFTPAISHSVEDVRFKMYRQGTIPGDLVVKIYSADADGEPIGSPLTTGSISCSSIAVNPPTNWYTIDLGVAAPLTAGNRYAITVEAANGNTSTDRIWYQASSTNPYPINNIGLNLVYGTDRNNRVATFDTSINTLSVAVGGVPQISGETANNFTSPVTYTVTAEDSTTQDWKVTVGIAPNTEADFKTFNLPGQTSSYVNSSQNRVTVTVPFAADISNLIATFTTSDYTNSVKVDTVPQVSGSTANDFTSAVTYTITAQDGVTTEDWEVNVIHDPPSQEADILTYSLPGQTGCVIGDGIITVSVLHAADVTDLVATFTTSPLVSSVVVDTTLQQSGASHNNFTDNVTYTVWSENAAASREWVVTISRDPPDTGAEILTFGLPGQTGMTKNATNGTITINVLYGTDLTNLVATYTTSPLVSSVTVEGIPQTSGITTNDFSTPVTYRVTSQDVGVWKDWLVTVTKDPPSTVADMTVFTLPGQVSPSEVAPNHGWMMASYNNGSNWADIASRTWDMQFKEGFDATDYESYTLVAASSDYFAGNTIKAQNFIPTTSHTVNRIDLKLMADGNPTGDILVTLRTTDVNTGRPTSVILATGQIACSTLGDTVFSWYSFELDTPADLVAGDRYAICMSAPSANITDRVWFNVAINNPYPIGKINVTLPYGTDPTALVATFNTSPYVNSVRVGPTPQISGETPNNFAGLVTYAVTAENTTFVRDWVVNATVLPNTAADILSYSIPGQKAATIDSTAGTIKVVMPLSSNVTALVANFTASPDAASVKINGLEQTSGVTVNNFSGEVTYTVTAQDGISIRDWVVTVSVSPHISSISPSSGSSAGGTVITITGFNFTGATGATIGGVPASHFEVVSDTQITATTPPGTAGAKDVIVSSPGGSSTLTMGFTYIVYSDGGIGGGGGGGGGITGPGTIWLTPYINTDGFFNLPATIVSEDGNVILSIAKGVLAQTKEGTALRSLKIIPMPTQPISTDLMKFILPAHEITPEGATFSPAVNLTIKYDIAALPEDIELNSLALAVYDMATGEWEPIPSTHDKSDGSVTAEISYLSNYAVIGETVSQPAPTTTPTPTITPTTTPPPTTTTPPATTTVPPTTTPTSTVPTTTPSGGGSGTNWGLIWGIIAAVVVLGAIAVILVLRSKSKK